MSNVDIGIPIGGCVSISGSSVVPDNFRAMNGAVLNEPRSPLDGMTLPDWNRDDIQTVLTQSAPFDGSVSDESSQTIQFQERHLPLNISLKKTFKVDFTVSTSTTKATGLGGEGTIVFGQGNTFTNNIWYGNSMGRVDGSQIGSGTQYYYKSDANEIDYTFLNEHTHTVTFGQHDHDFTYFSSSNPYVGTDVFGIRPSSTNNRSNTINGSSNPNRISIPKERPALKMHWYIRVY